ncbi:TlpA family protein disulfide reductase [Nocardioides limicola]|uniref:TlpA family protein disulfide reductase n=1 Tax=Nocardioides limicola TaxID=2803368 RepID=UPI00193B8848|nr:TlpA disulfide reductase family protein [Nocardioides sp. DJM-14]
MTARIAALLTVALLALTGCGGGQGTGDKGYITGDGTVRELPVADRGTPVRLDGVDLAGEPLSVADLRGTPVVVIVWGSWCPPCRAEAPELAELAHARDDVAFVGINIRDPSEANGLSFNRRFGIDYPSFFSPTGEALLAFRGTLTPNSIPSTVVLDASGRVAASIIGPLPSIGTLNALIDTVVDEVGQDG